MNKSRQKELTRWLKQQSVISQRWLNISRLLGFVSGILIIAQAWFMARILQHMIMENIPREALLLPFTLLVLTFVLRAWVVWLRERVGYHAGQHIRFAIRRQVLDRLQQAGPAWIQGKPAGSWATLVLDLTFESLIIDDAPQSGLDIIISTFSSNSCKQYPL